MTSFRTGLRATVACAALIATLAAHAAITANALTNNALTNNAITSNALTNNAITSNGLHVNGLAPSAAQATPATPAPTTPTGAYTPARAWTLSTVRVEGAAAASR